MVGGIQVNLKRDIMDLIDKEKKACPLGQAFSLEFRQIDFFCSPYIQLVCFSVNVYDTLLVTIINGTNFITIFTVQCDGLVVISCYFNTINSST